MSRILFLSGWFPYPPDNGSKLRIYNLLSGLAHRHEVTLLTFADQPGVKPDAPALRLICPEIYVAQWKPFSPRNWRALLGFLSVTPRSMVDTFSAEMQQLIHRAISSGNYDLVIASQTITARYGPSFRGLPALFEEPEIGTLYEQPFRAKTGRHRLRYSLTWAKHRRYLSRLFRYYRACTVVSDREERLLRTNTADCPQVEVIPNCVNLAEYGNVQQQPQPNTLIFSGSLRYSANHDAMVWFVGEIFPRIRGQIPDIHLTITGDNTNRALPPGDGVELTGLVPDVRPLIASSRVSLAPIRLGGGTRLKILEAMALRTPVVATSKGAEGLEVRHDQHLLIADTPEAFAQAVIRLSKEDGLRQRLTENAYQVVREKYDWAVVMPRFLNLVDRIANA
jgi:glycosyltransferase involved in cell wall biosynthesis